VISYSEEVHQPTTTTSTANAQETASLNADSLAESHRSFKVGLSLVTKLGIALGLALALWMARKRIRALLPF
jgi:hypothetical protein